MLILKAKQEYKAQRYHARRRGKEFLLTFEEWCLIWTNSGRYQERGRLKHQYCMARMGDVGPYVIGNVKIITMSARMSAAHLGKKMSAEACAKMSAAKKAHWAARRIVVGVAQTNRGVV
jgi:hypothetical protein